MALTPEQKVEIAGLLQQDLTGEEQAILQYIQSMYVARGLFEPQITELLMDIAQEEMEHLESVGRQISHYGGIPNLTILKEVILDPVILESMEIGVRLETATIEQYVAHRDRFEELGESGLVQIIEGIIQEEQEHLIKFSRILE